jgi:proline iminopeptidase
VTDLYVETAGRSDAAVSLLFMHGGMGLDHASFRPFVDALGDVARLVFYDHRLNGRSPRTSANGVDMALMARDALDVATGFCHGAVVPVGHSFGSLVALAMASTFPSHVQGLVATGQALSPTVGATLMAHVTRIGSPAQQDAIARAFGGTIESDDEFAAAWREVVPLYLHRQNADLHTRLLARVRFSALGFNAFIKRCFGQLDYRDKLSRLQVPALFIAGGSDWCERDPAGGSPAAARVTPRGTCVVLEESGHFPFAEQPERFCATIRSWLASERLIA